MHIIKFSIRGTLLRRRRRGSNRGRGAGTTGAEGREITVGSAPVDNWSGILACFFGWFCILKGHLDIQKRWKKPWVIHYLMLVIICDWDLNKLITHKAIAFGSSGDLIGDDDSFQDVTILVKVFFHGFLRCFPCQPSYKHLCKRRITHVAHRHL